MKVLKDWANRPFSFVQYTTAQEANYALQKGQKATLDGRMIRVERARVNRTLYISKDKGKFDEAVNSTSINWLVIVDPLWFLCSVVMDGDNCRLSKHSLNRSVRLRRLSLLVHGNVPAKNAARDVLQNSYFAMMRSTLIR